MESSTSRTKRIRTSVDEIQPREKHKYVEVKLHWKVKERLMGSGFDYLFDLDHKVFALVRIPRLIPHVYKDRDAQSLNDLSFPMIVEFTNIIGRDEMVDNYHRPLDNEFEAILMSLNEHDVKWTYHELPQSNKYYEQEWLGYSITTPLADGFPVKHQPQLAPRQFPLFKPNNRLIQQWVQELPDENVGRKKKKGEYHITPSIMGR
ncbi:hypothetical protein SESBI_40951 [Sesbania bispinosa]|nr:hypothetical protein SESBI_40951 [Sesbania bispinosa]